MRTRIDECFSIVAAAWSRIDSPSGVSLALLNAKCVRCHGEKVKKADLDLSTPAEGKCEHETQPDTECEIF